MAVDTALSYVGEKALIKFFEPDVTVAIANKLISNLHPYHLVHRRMR